MFRAILRPRCVSRFSKTSCVPQRRGPHGRSFDIGARLAAPETDGDPRQHEDAPDGEHPS